MSEFKVTRTVTIVDGITDHDQLKISQVKMYLANNYFSSTNNFFVDTKDLPNLIKKLQEAQKQYATN